MPPVGVNPNALRVSEIFGPTLQGEGPNAGRRAGFLRLGGCNLDCAWCDTPYTWDWARFDPRKELHRMVVEDVQTKLGEMGVDLVVITGGEPLLQQRHLAKLIDVCWPRMRFEFETNGTVAVGQNLLDRMTGERHPRIRFNVSPKLSNSGIDHEKRVIPAVLEQFIKLPGTIFKFVVAHVDDLDEVDALVSAYEIPDGMVWLMPEGTNRETISDRAELVADAAIQRGWNFTHRMHIVLWGNERGR